MLALFTVAISDIATCNYRRALVVINSLFVFIFIGLRYKLGVDWQFYYDDYHGVKTNLAIEPGYELLAKLSGYFINFWAYVSLITLLAIYSIARFAYRTSPYPAFVIGCYFIISFGFNIEALRQIIAVSMFYLGLFEYLLGRKRFFYFFCVAGSFFHISLLPLVMLPVLFGGFTLKILRNLFICGMVLALIRVYPVKTLIEFGNAIIGGPYFSKLAWYALNGNDGGGVTFNLLFKVIIYAFFYFSKPGISRCFSELNVNIKLITAMESIFLLMLVIDVYFLPFGTIASRYDEFFVPVMLICFSYFLRSKSLLANRMFISIGFMILVSISFMRFTDNDYFEEQYKPYSNSIVQLLTYSVDDAARAKAVFLHWQLRNE